MPTQRTLVIIKPDAHKRDLAGKIRKCITDKGFEIKASFFRTTQFPELVRHYQEHIESPYYNRLMDFMNEGPLEVFIVEGPDAIKQIRLLAGVADPLKRDMGSIRGRWSNDWMLNLIHTSADEASAERELNLWFGEGSWKPSSLQ